MTFKLRDYQQAAIDETYRYWADKKGDHPLIVAPTGAGKSLIIAQMIKDAMSFQGTRVLLLTHVKELIQQNAEKLISLAPECASDVGIYSAGLGQKRLDKQITFAGIQSVWKRAYDMVPAPDLVLIDEAHMLPKNAETRYGQFIKDLTICNPAVKIVGLTATPYRLDSGVLHEGDGAIFDGISYDIPITTLIDAGFLSPVFAKAAHRQIDLSDVKKRGGEFVEADLARAASDPELVAETVAEIVKLGADRKSWLIFSSGVAHAEMLHDGIAAEGISVVTILGSDAPRDRTRKIADYKAGKVRCLVNCDVLTTGFDAPAVDLVAIVRATESAGLYVQIVGRGTRISPATGKTDCLVLDFGGNVQRHGLLDQIKPKRASTGDGVAPVKECPECEFLMATATRLCPNCGHEFPPPELNHVSTAYSGAMLSTQVVAEWSDVDDVTYERWKKEGKPDSLRVTYHCGLTRISEWLCPSHGGYAASRYHARMPSLVASAMTTDEALDECNGWVKPSRVKTVPDGKFQKIVQFDYKPKEVDHAAQAEKEKLAHNLREMFADEIPF